MSTGFRTSQLTLIEPTGHRKYLTEQECTAFMMQSETIDIVKQMYCLILYATGCRPTEALELTIKNINIHESKIVFRSLKKRKFDKEGKAKPSVYRQVPILPSYMKQIDLVFNVRNKTKHPSLADQKLFTLSRTAMFRMVKSVMKDAGIKGPQATAKGLRHAYALRLAKSKACITVIQELLGHTDLETSAVYLRFSQADTANVVYEAFGMQQNTTHLMHSEYASRYVA